MNAQNDFASKATLPQNRRERPYRDTADVIAGLRRQIRRLGERIAQEDPEQFAELVALNDDLEAAIRVAIAGQRAVGTRDRDLADVLGVTRQAVEQRWPRPTRSTR